MDAFWRLAERHGRLGLADALGPVAEAFEAGVPVAPRVAFDWAAAQGTLQGAARDVYLPGGAPPRVGARVALPGQAAVLRRIIREGRAGFYEGEVAEDIVASLRATGGAHTLDDLAATRADWTDPIAGPYRGLEIVEHPPNGQGATALLLAAILSRFDVAALDPLGAPRVHLEAEATKLAYDARDRIVADPDHTTRLAAMLDPDMAARLAALIDPRRAMPAARPRTEAIHRDTVYICVVDGDGMAVSLIYSLFHAFGSGIVTDRFGILLQNRGAGFTLEAGHPNEYGPGKRPMHTIIPGILREGGRVVMPFGVMGGAYQSTGHARFVSNLADFGMDPQAAIDAPRAFADPGTGALMVERGYGEGVRAALAALGHDVRVPDGPLGGAQAIRIHADGVLEGASDPRKDGCALGY